MERVLLTTILAIFAMTWTSPAQNDDLKPWPAAAGSYQRFVIRLPELPNEEGRKVEIVMGKTAKLEAHNRYLIAGEFEKRSIRGGGTRITDSPAAEGRPKP